MIVGSLLLPAFVAGTCLSILSALRMRARNRHEIRLRQLQESADLISLHAGALDRFLGDKDAPIALKRVLITYSDAMADKTTVLKLAEWLSLRPLQRLSSQEDQGDKDLAEELANLVKTRPELVKEFSHAVMTIAVGAILRWPDSAALVEQVGARIAATTERDIDLAVTASSFGKDDLFTLSMRTHAMA